MILFVKIGFEELLLTVCYCGVLDNSKLYVSIVFGIWDPRLASPCL